MHLTKPISGIILHSEISNFLVLCVEVRQEFPLKSQVFHFILEIPVITIEQEKYIKT